MIWPDHVSCFVWGARLVRTTSTAWNFWFLGGMGQTLYVTSSPSTGTYSPSMLQERKGEVVAVVPEPRDGPLPQTTQNEGRHLTHQLCLGKENPQVTEGTGQAETHVHPTETSTPQPTSLQPHADGVAPLGSSGTTQPWDLLRHMHEYVLCAILWGDKPVALGARELLADTLEDGASGGTRCPAGGKGRFFTGGTCPGGGTERDFCEVMVLGRVHGTDAQPWAVCAVMLGIVSAK